jgi:hypothetical protein
MGSTSLSVKFKTAHYQETIDYNFLQALDLRVTPTGTVRDKFRTAYQSQSSSRTPIHKEQAQVKHKIYQFALLQVKLWRVSRRR